MFEKISKWLDWNIRIAFIDKVWTPLFPPDETQRLLMSAEELKRHKTRFSLNSVQMAKMLSVPTNKFKEWEKNGIHGPGDDGPASVFIRLIAKILDERSEQKNILDSLGYCGKI
jgi:hypothetical protein